MNNTEEWFLMGNPAKVTIILIGYLIFVIKLGPSFMKNRPPMKLSIILATYNLFQVALSAYLTFVGFAFCYKYGVLGSECLVKKESIASQIQVLNHLYFTAKFTELLDTVFFVLRKKQNQVTFLHVFHHAVMFMMTWAVLKYDLTDATIFSASLNSLIHVVMYSYYGLSVIPSISKYLWWKKYITSMQLVQFMMMLTHIMVYNQVAKCPPSKTLIYFLDFLILTFLVLFTRFYIKSYTKKLVHTK